MQARANCIAVALRWLAGGRSSGATSSESERTQRTLGMARLARQRTAALGSLAGRLLLPLATQARAREASARRAEQRRAASQHNVTGARPCAPIGPARCMPGWLAGGWLASAVSAASPASQPALYAKAGSPGSRRSLAELVAVVKPLPACTRPAANRLHQRWEAAGRNNTHRSNCPKLTSRRQASAGLLLDAPLAGWLARAYRATTTDVD